MIINKIDNIYIVKILNTNINLYSKEELEQIAKQIIFKINKNYKFQNTIHLEFYQNKNYGTIIKITDYNTSFIDNKEKTVKITIHTETHFLYKLDYFSIKHKNTIKHNIYYYKKNFYLEIENDIPLKDYLNILESSEVIYEDTDLIIDKAIKI